MYTGTGGEKVLSVAYKSYMIKVETAVIAKVAMSNNVSAAGTKGQKQLYPKRRVKTCSDSFSKLLQN
jgi:hypothetical protein